MAYITMITADGIAARTIMVLARRGPIGSNEVIQ